MKPITIILLSIVCLLIGHIVGYFVRRREEKPGKISLFVDKDKITMFKEALIGVEYNGTLVEECEIRGIDPKLFEDGDTDDR